MSAASKFPRLPGLASNAAHVPGLHLGHVRRQEVNVVQCDWRRLIPDLDEFDLGVVRRHGKRDVGLLVDHERQIVLHFLCRRRFGARHHRPAGGFHAVNHPPDIRHAEREMIHRRALGAPCRCLLAQEHERIRESDDGVWRGRGVDERAAERFDEESPVRVDAGDVQVVVAVGSHRSLSVTCRQSRVGGGQTASHYRITTHSTTMTERRRDVRL